MALIPRPRVHLMIAKVLTSLGLSADGRVLARSRGPPQAQLELDLPAVAAARAA